MKPFARFRSVLLIAALLAGPVIAVSPMSEATRRAQQRGYDKTGPEFHVAFKQHPLKGDLAFEKGVIRRDPSSVIRIDGVYHVWYTRGLATKVVGFGSSDPTAKAYAWDLTDVWHATSPDGWTWSEQGLAVGRGPAGSYDDRAVFTPEVLRHGGKFYLVYQVVQAPYRSRTKNQVGMAIADRPGGPWLKLEEPILSPTNDGKWKGDVDDRGLYEERGSFDSYKVHDPMLFFFKDRFYLYYKGQGIGERLAFGGREIKHGLAISDRVEGPYVKSEYNPISNSGHEVAMWRYRGGIATLLTTDGPERDTIQWSPDGVNFSIKARIKDPPKALGIFRPEDYRQNNVLPAGLQWGLAHRHHGPNENSITRYEVFRRQLKDPGIRRRRASGAR